MIDAPMITFEERRHIRRVCFSAQTPEEFLVDVMEFAEQGRIAWDDYLELFQRTSEAAMPLWMFAWCKCLEWALLKLKEMTWRRRLS